MGIICKYKFDSSIYADLIPEFNSGYSGYVITDEVEGNIITRTIESESLPTLMRFGQPWVEGESATDNRTGSLLEILDMNTSELIDCNSMFRYNKNLTSISCNWGTSKVTNMSRMFNGCNNLTTLDVSNFDTSKVTNMSYMFSSCHNLTSLDVSNWNTSNVTNMAYTFHNCAKLTSLDVSNWNTSNVSSMQQVFDMCYTLNVDVSNWDTSNVSIIYAMFGDCRMLSSLDLTKWNTSKMTNMLGVFWGCINLVELNISSWDTSKVTNMKKMFYNCTKLTTLDVSNFNTSNVADTTDMFVNSNSLEVITMFNSDINTINVVGNLTSATIYVDESLDQSQYTGTAPLKVYKEEKLEIKLNSPLLKGDTIEVKDGKICHVHRWGKVVLDGSENWDKVGDFFLLRKKNLPSPLKENDISYYNQYGDNFIVDRLPGQYIVANNGTYGFGIASQDTGNGGTNLRIRLENINTLEDTKQWLSENPTTIIYKLETPYYEDITPLQSSLVLRTFLESSMTIDTILPIETKLSYRTNVPSISTLSTRATELAESDNVIHNLMNIIDDEVDE